MGKISVFNFLSIDGCFAGPNGEIDWFKDIPKDAAYSKYSKKMSKAKSTLVFGRTTYEMMKSFWPTEMARQLDPVTADIMANSQKIVFSEKMKNVKEEHHWKNIMLLRGIDKNEIKKLKAKNEDGFTILGSGTIVQQLSDLGLIDNYTLVIVPIVLGKGKSLFKNVNSLHLKLTGTKRFKNGIIINHYERKK